MDKFQKFSVVFENHLPSVKSCYISLGCFFVFGVLTCIIIRIQDDCFSIMSQKDQVLISLGCWLSFTCFLVASIIPMSPIWASLLALMTLFSDAPAQVTCLPTANEIVMVEEEVREEEQKTIFFDEARRRHKFETQGQQLPVEIGDGSSLNEYYIPSFLRGGSYKEVHHILIEGLQSQQWSQTDLCRIALLIQLSGILKAPYSSNYSKWVKAFFKVLGRDDCPYHPNKNKYTDWSKSRVAIENSFFTLVDYYVKTGDTTIILRRCK